MEDVKRNLVVRGRRRRRGIALVEMALVLPVLLLLTFGVIEFGWMFTTTSQVTNAARNGVRLGVRPDSTSADVEDAIASSLAAVGLAEGDYTVVIDPEEVDGLDPGTAITVTITVPYANVDLTGFPLPTPDNIVVSVTMVKEGPE